MAPYESVEDHYSAHKKLTRLINREMVPVHGRVGKTTDYDEASDKFDTQVMFTGNMARTQITLQPKSVGKMNGQGPAQCGNPNEAFLLSSEAHRDGPYRYDYDYPSNVLNSIFGYNSKAQNWFNGILGCLRPFWSIIGPKEAQSEAHDDWEIPFEHLKDLQWLGSGAQGAVFIGEFTLTGNFFRARI